MDTTNHDGWRANVVRDDFVMDGLRLVIGQRGSDMNYYVDTITDSHPGMTSVERHVDGPTIYMPTDMARALLDALAAHFGGTGTARELRADLNAERARVDRLLGVVSTVATRGTS